jgi:uncharacterized protein involved in exopolysaccharide biosynthesis
VSASSVDLYEPDAFDIRQLLPILRAHWRLIAASIVLMTALAAAVAFLSPPIYRSSIVLVPTSSDASGLAGGLGSALGQFGGLAALAGINLGPDGMATEESLAVLKSRQFTEAFIADQQLMPILFAKSWDAQNGKWKEGEQPPTAGKAYKYFDQKVRSIDRDKKTQIVTVNVEWRDRERAAQWANELIARLNAEMRARAIARTDASVGYLEKELETTSTVATREAINRLIETQIKQRMLANVTPEYAFRVVDRAVPADRNDPIRPKKLVLLLAGPFVGLILGIGAALLASWGWLMQTPRRRAGQD